FLLAVADGDALDNNGLVEVRMKISNNSGVLYDSQPGAADSAVPTTPLVVPAGSGGGASAPPGQGGPAERPTLRPVSLPSGILAIMDPDPDRSGWLIDPTAAHDRELTGPAKALPQTVVDQLFTTDWTVGEPTQPFGRGQ